MIDSSPKQRAQQPGCAGPARPDVRLLAQSDDWRITEQICCAGPADTPFEERHECAAIALVLEGSFQYRADTGNALLHPGALMLGNVGTSFECAHEHSVGDRCLAVHYAPQLFEEIAATARTGKHKPFSTPMLPPLRPLAARLVDLSALKGRADAAFAAEIAIEIAEQVLQVTWGNNAGLRYSASGVRRVSKVLRHIDGNLSSALFLDDMADMAGLSKYHFLRTFRRCTGLTPHQYLLISRLRLAALALRESQAPVTDVALDSGFGDLSTFNAQFRRVFGTTPSAYRRQHTPNGR